MADQHLQRKPHRIRRVKDAWWYEDPKGVYVCTEAHNECGAVSVKCRVIPWESLRGALARLDKP